MKITLDDLKYTPRFKNCIWGLCGTLSPEEYVETHNKIQEVVDDPKIGAEYFEITTDSSDIQSLLCAGGLNPRQVRHVGFLLNLIGVVPIARRGAWVAGGAETAVRSGVAFVDKTVFETAVGSVTISGQTEELTYQYKPPKWNVLDRIDNGHDRVFQKLGLTQFSNIPELFYCVVQSTLKRDETCHREGLTSVLEKVARSYGHGLVEPSDMHMDHPSSRLKMTLDLRGIPYNIPNHKEM